ncbi:MAG: hypothetical protein WBM83_11200 [Flavobacteriaceae bacterium]
MKITKFVALLLFFATCTVGAQEIADHALGLRLGDSDGFGAEISYQKSMFRYNRLELDLGWRDSRVYDAVKLAAVYQWIHNIDGPLNWYYGFGGGTGSAKFDPVPNNLGPATVPDGGLFIFGAGDVGIEYTFDFPLLISLDFRPELGVIGYGDFSDRFDFDIALGIRYTF